MRSEGARVCAMKALQAIANNDPPPRQDLYDSVDKELSDES